jgi:hypothetical protein
MMRITNHLLIATLLVIGSEQTADAYCRTSTCEEPVCSGQISNPACIPIAWKRPCLGVSVQVDASNQVAFDEANAIVNEAFRSWNTAKCDESTGATPNIYVENLGPVECTSVEFNEAKGGNANVVVFRDEVWPQGKDSSTIALTTVTFSKITGEIVDADIEVNSAGDFTFTLSDSDVQTDLLSIMTHEAGHFLGMAHSYDIEATMWASYGGGIEQRTLESDDVSGICAAYPPLETPIDPATCNPIPKYGFSSACLSQQTERSCSVHPGIGTRQESSSVLMVASLAILASSRRIRRQRVRPRS